MQIREDVFIDIVRAELLRTPVPSNIVENLYATGEQFGEPLLIERIEFPEILIVNSTPSIPQVQKGKLYIQVNLQLFLTTFSNAKAAGHLGVPATLAPVEVSAWIRFDLSHEKIFSYTVVDSTQPFQVSGTLGLDIPLPIDIIFWQTAILSGGGVVVVRIGTEEQDATIGLQTFLDAWIVNRLGSANWGVFVNGEVLSRQLDGEVYRAANQFSSTSSDPKIVIASHSNAWVNPDHVAQVDLKLTAVDAGFLDSDVSIDITVKAGFESYLNTAVKINTRVEWDAPDEVANNLAEIARRVFGASNQVDSGDDFVAFSTTQFLNGPRSHSFSASITALWIDDNGLEMVGIIAVLPRPNADWVVTSPNWKIGGDCHSRTVGVKFIPASVTLVGTDPYFEPRLMKLPPPSEPAEFWNAVINRSLYGVQPITFEVEFQSRLLGDVPDGIAMSASLYSNLGVRWVDFGTVPLKPVVSQQQLLARTFALISQCMAISDRWGMGVLNLSWLVDPPVLRIDYGHRAVQEWLIVGTGIRETNEVELMAIKRDGTRRRLGTAPVIGGGLLLHRIITNFDESLELRTGVLMSGRVPTVMQRWIIPKLLIPVGKSVKSFTLAGETLRLSYEDGSAKEVLINSVPDTKNTGSQDSPDDSVIHPSQYRMLGSPRAIIESRGGIAVLHEKNLIMGIATNFEPAVSTSNRE